MHMRVLAGLTLILGCLTAGPVGAQTGSPTRGIPTSAVLSRYGLEVAWTGQAVINPGRDKVSHVVMDEELVFVQGTNGVITAFDSETGRQHWSVRVGRYDEPNFPAVTNEEVCLVVSGLYMYGLDKRTGDILWRLRLPSVPSTGPAADETQVYLGMLDGSVYAFSLKKIRERFLEQRLPEWSHETIVWRYQAAEEVTSPPIPLDQSVVFASRDGSLYSVTKDRRVLNYQFETDAPIMAPMALVGQTLFLASEDFNFYAINSNNGVVLWEFVTGLPIRKAPIALGTSLYLSPDRGGLYGLQTNTGARRWWHPRLTDFVSLINHTVVARDVNNDLALVDSESGDILGRIPASFYDLHATNSRNDRIYLATSRGQVMAIREAGRNYPIYHRYPERRPILPEIAPEEEAATEPKPPEPMDSAAPETSN